MSSVAFPFRHEKLLMKEVTIPDLLLHDREPIPTTSYFSLFRRRHNPLIRNKHHTTKSSVCGLPPTPFVPGQASLSI